MLLLCVTVCVNIGLKGQKIHLKFRKVFQLDFLCIYVSTEIICYCRVFSVPLWSVFEQHWIWNICCNLLHCTLVFCKLLRKYSLSIWKSSELSNFKISYQGLLLPCKSVWSGYLLIHVHTNSPGAAAGLYCLLWTIHQIVRNSVNCFASLLSASIPQSIQQPSILH